MKKDILLLLLYALAFISFVINDYTMITSGTTEKLTTYLILTVFFFLLMVIYIKRVFFRKDQ